MIFLRAIPFSFSILWRYAIVLPLLILAMIMFGIVAILPVLIIGLIAPFLGVLVAASFGAAAGVVPIMVGTRVGMQAKEVRPSNTYFGLMLPALGYGLFEAFCVFLIIALSVIVYVLGTPLTPEDFIAVDPDDYGGLFAMMTDASPVLTIGCIVIGGGLIFALRACLLMPLTGASVGADPSGRAHTPFYGIGSGFSSLFPLVIISQIGTAMVVPLVAFLSVPLGIADIATDKIDQLAELDELADLSTLGVEFAMFCGLCLFFFLFFFSLQCAGGVLVYMRHKDAVDRADQAFAKSVEKDLAGDQPTQPEVDVMDLVRSRMQNKDRQ